MDVRRTVKVFPGLGMSVDIVEYEGQMYAASGTDAWDAACGVDKGPLYIMRRDALTGTWSIIQYVRTSSLSYENHRKLLHPLIVFL